MLAGLYDPAENGLTIDMWSNSDGDQIKQLLDRINNPSDLKRLAQEDLHKLADEIREELINANYWFLKKERIKAMYLKQLL